jgi:hemerythrin-like domain-containing protein
MKCTELLEKDHRIIHRAIDVLEEMAAEVMRGHSVDSNDVESIVRFLKEFEDEHHQTKEESALFPVLVKNAGPQQTKLGQIVFEHDQERSLLEGLQDALKTKQGTDFVHFATRLISLLRSHIHKEEFALFGLIEMTVTDEQDKAIVADFRRFDNELENRDGAELAGILQKLERRYLRKRIA